VDELSDKANTTHCTWKSSDHEEDGRKNLKAKEVGFLEPHMTQILLSKMRFIEQIRSTTITMLVY
jgi:hypothetical protein